MNTSTSTEIIDQDRRRLLGTVATGIAVAAAASMFPSRLNALDSGAAIRPFRVNVPKEQLADLRRRLAATRWPDKETVSDRSQGVQLGRPRAMSAETIERIHELKRLGMSVSDIAH